MSTTFTRRRHRPAVIAAAAAAALTAGVVTPLPAASAAEGPTPIIHYTFDTASDGVITDASGNGHDGVIRQSGATVSDGRLTLPGGAAGTAGYLEIPTDAIAGQQQLTVSTWLEGRSGAANTAAAFIGAPVATGASFSDSYWLLNPTNPSGYVKSVFTSTRSASAPWSTEVGPGASNTATSGIRTPAGPALYTTVIDGEAGLLTAYVNGEQIGETAITRDVSSFGADLVSYLGRSTYNDVGWSGDVEDYAVYDQALDAEQVQHLFAADALGLAAASVSVPETATADFALPTTSHGTTITWESDSAAIEVTDGTAVVTRPTADEGDAVATLTATFTLADDSTTRTYPVTVLARLSDEAITQADAEGLAPATEDVRTNFSVPTVGEYGSTITWAVIGGDGIATIGDGVNESSASVVVTRPAAGSADAEFTLRATATSGDATTSRDFDAIVRALPADEADPEAYVWAFFTGEGAGAERVSLAASQGNDALRWNTLNDGEPIFTSEQGTEGLRDPFIIRSHEGDKFYMIATDLKIAGLPGGFSTAQKSGSLAIEVWESTDLVNWSEQRHVQVSSPYAGNTWAPEAFWDDEIGRYVVFWASNLYDTTDAASRSAVTYNRMMYATTDDFVTFSDAEVWTDVSRGTGRGMIDSTVAKVDDTYYRFTKDEGSMTIRLEKSTNLLATNTGTLPTAEGADDEWTLIKEKIATGLSNGEPGKTFTSGEGPSIFPANPGDENGFDWYLFIDQPDYHGGPNHYIPFGSTDITDGSSWQPLGETLRENLPQNSDGGKPRHGTVIPVTRAEYQAVLEAYAPAIAVAEVAPIEVDTRTGVAPVLPAATLTATDGTESTVDVAWDEIDPAQYASAGSFTVNGIAQDASRMPVAATVTVSAPGLTADASTRCVAGKVVVTTKVTNESDAVIAATVTTTFGERTLTVQPGASASAAFSTRLASVEAGEVVVTAADAGEIQVEHAARSCG